MICLREGLGQAKYLFAVIPEEKKSQVYLWNSNTNNKV